MTEVFISAETQHDMPFARALKSKLEATYQFKVHLIVRDKHPNAELTTLIKTSIFNSRFFIPILTENSYTNQWVNQEIGYAVGLQHARLMKISPIPPIEIFPLVQEGLVDKLRGFISLTQKLDHQFKIGVIQRISSAPQNEEENPNVKRFLTLVDDVIPLLIDIISPIYISEHTLLDLPKAKIFMHNNRAVLIYKGKWHWIMDHQTTERLIGLHKVPFDKKTKLDERKYPKGKEIYFERPIPEPPVKDPF